MGLLGGLLGGKKTGSAGGGGGGEAGGGTTILKDEIASAQYTRAEVAAAVAMLREAAARRWGPPDVGVARLVFECRSSQYTWIQMRVDDVASRYSSPRPVSPFNARSKG